MSSHYSNNKNLRRGYTTGTCATAAAKAGTIMLLCSNEIDYVSITTPNNVTLNLKVLDKVIEKDFVSCAIKKDSGDDPDITNNILVYAKVEKTSKKGVHITGGKGIGKVTKKGLEHEIGDYAINSTPKLMIKKEVLEVIEASEINCGISVTIYVPQGEEIAKKTYNSRLGIIGGISILGTSGIVEPMSTKAIIDTIKLEMKIRSAQGRKIIPICTGNYGETFIKEHTKIDINKVVKCSNYIGETLDYAKELGFKGILFIGHVGKLVKIAGSIMDTHSKMADCRMEIICAHSALFGAKKEAIKEIMDCVTCDGAIDVLEKYKLKDKVFCSIMEKINIVVNNRCENEVEVGVIMFSNKHGILGKTNNAQSLLGKIVNKID